jgi:large subunit ribosomal protein L22
MPTPFSRIQISALSVVIYKTVKSAEANAVQQLPHGSQLSLHRCDLTPDDGPRLKRSEPRAKGSSSPIIKRMSSVTVVLKSKGAK